MRPLRLGLAILTLGLLSLGLIFMLGRRDGPRAPAPNATAGPARAEPAEPLKRSSEALEHRELESGTRTEPPEAVPAETPTPSTNIGVYSPLGTMEGLVLRGGEPSAEGEAWMKRDLQRDDDGWCARSGPDAGSERVRVGSDGTFRFLAEPGDFCVGVELAQGQRRTRMFHVVKGEPSKRWVIALGSSELHGRVWTADGLPALGVSIRFSGYRPAAPGAIDMTSGGSTRTDLDGNYRITGLDPGAYGLEALLGADRFDPLNQYVYSTELGPDEVKTVDIGSARPLPVWTCRVLCGRGTLLPQGSRDMTLEDRVGRTTFLVRQESDGSFRSHLRPGTYAITLSFLREARALGEIVMGEQDQESEFRLPGAWVAVSVRYVGTGNPLFALAQLGVLATLRGSPEKSLSACPSGDGHWNFFDVSPGEYEVWTSDAGIHMGSERFPLLVREGEAEIPMEITVGDR